MRALLLLGTLAVAGLTGAALTLAGVRSPVTGPLTLVFVLFTPALCVALLLSGLDLLARAIVAGTASLALAGAIAEVMLVTAGWSPRGGVVATAIACAALGVAAVVLRRRARPVEPAIAPPPGEPAHES
ncbi:hypothetical protein OG417_47265 [Actinoallomurus sp. NBC_01490]|uniref:hypothetical protein n=1 Tax=Actinoallomurus sp. NBC_01490 TaxID=2903557 RepID=UPI002E35C98B|nr:hypothetical protein [Actinoallomurus sp. NBC_01490]